MFWPNKIIALSFAQHTKIASTKDNVTFRRHKHAKAQVSTSNGQMIEYEKVHRNEYCSELEQYHYVRRVFYEGVQKTIGGYSWSATAHEHSLAAGSKGFLRSGEAPPLNVRILL